MARWRFFLGDKNGVPIANYTALIKDVQFGFRFLRPDALQFRVPADHVDVAGLHTDGDPRLHAMSRTIRAFRQEPDGSYRIRFAGVIWKTLDVGDHDTAYTTVTAFSPMQRLANRFTPSDVADRTGQGGAIYKTLIDETNADGFTGIATTGFGNVLQTTPTRTAKYDRRVIGEAGLELASAYNGFDPICRPIYQAPGTENGTLAALDIYARAGGNQANTIFAWGMAPHNVAHIERMVDGDTLANVIDGYGYTPAGTTTAIHSNTSTAASIAKYGMYRAIETMGDVTNQAFLDELMQEEAALRANPRDMVKITPAVSDGSPRFPVPWHDFDIGDTVQVWAGPALRGGFVGLQRVYGFGLSLSDDNIESLDQIAASPDDA